MAHNSTAEGHQQSIGEENGQPVDGIAGSHPGTQEPSGAHVDAGGPVGGAAAQQEDKREGRRQAQVTKAVGMSGRGVAQPAGVVGMMGSPRADSDSGDDDGSEAGALVFDRQRRTAASPSRPRSSGM